MTTHDIHRPVADLHNHTRYSDGELSPTELWNTYRQAGYVAMAITDHDTLEGLQGLLADRDHQPAPPEIVPGVELTLGIRTDEFCGSLHLLLYFPESLLQCPGFLPEMRRLFDMGRGPQLLERRLEALNRHLAGKGRRTRVRRTDFNRFAGRITRRNIFQVLLHHGLNDQEARHLLANDSPVYIPSGVDPAEARPILQQYPLVKILAHPAAGSFPGPSHYKEVYPPFETVRRLGRTFHQMFGLDGLEVYYPAHTPAYQQAIRDFGHELGVDLWTGGSDCHDLDGRPPHATGMPAADWEKFRIFLIRKQEAINF